GKFVLFLKQLVAVVLCIFLVRYAVGKFQDQIKKNEEQVRTIAMQKKSEKEYLVNKQKLIALEPLFPDVSEKNQWLTGRLLDSFKKAEIGMQLEGNQTENASNASYVVASQSVGAVMNYETLGKFLEQTENLDDFLRVSSVSVTKDTNSQNIGKNKVSLRFNTIFLKQKIGRKIFKNFDELVAQQQKRAQEGGK
ncbi:MAG: hypothetical protein J5601_06665, partial [Elusimicrobiaceae bacterium]|nr:hypothetical protein [Elusimicrobiaceae bacterium]